MPRCPRTRHRTDTGEHSRLGAAHALNGSAPRPTAETAPATCQPPCATSCCADGDRTSYGRTTVRSSISPDAAPAPARRSTSYRNLTRTPRHDQRDHPRQPRPLPARPPTCCHRSRSGGRSRSCSRQRCRRHVCPAAPWRWTSPVRSESARSAPQAWTGAGSPTRGRTAAGASVRTIHRPASGHSRPHNGRTGRITPMVGS